MSIDISKPFHWPNDLSEPQFIIEPQETDIEGLHAWDVFELSPHYFRIGQVVQEDGKPFQAWGRVWDTSLGTLVPLWFRGPEYVKDGPYTDTVESAVSRIVQSWQHYTD